MDTLVGLLGSPVDLHELKHKPGRRRTLRAVGPRGAAIVKVYESRRAPTVAARLVAISEGPRAPMVPAVLHVDDDAHLLVVSEVPGHPLRHALLKGDVTTARRAGSVIGEWHQAWEGSCPAPLSDHTAERELEVLARQADSAPAEIRRAVVERTQRLDEPWTCSTVVHRDLYEEQVIVSEDGAIGLIDLDDMAFGPAELDIGNLVAHVELLAHRSRQSLDHVTAALLGGYADSGAHLDPELLDRCRRLTLLRLACIHRESALLEVAFAAL